MTTFTALTTLLGKINASDLGDALERLTPKPIGVGVFELEDGLRFEELELIKEQKISKLMRKIDRYKMSIKRNTKSAIKIY